MLELVLFDGTDRRFSLDEGAELMIGVEASCSVRLASVDVSRAHAMITCQKGRVVVLDLGSTNGTFVNGKRVKETELRAGDTVRFSSVMGQLMPTTSVTSQTEASSGERRLLESSSSGAMLRVTSEWQPLLMQEMLDVLLDRFGDVGQAALDAFCEWLVTKRGYAAAAVLEGVDSEVVVLAAHGEICAVLDDPQCGALVRRPSASGHSLQTVQLTVADKRVLAVQTASSPWLLIAVGRSMPDSAELPFLLRLLRVARRLDTA